MQIQLCQYCRIAHPYFSYFFCKFSFLWLLRVHFFMFSFLTSKKYLLLHLLAYSEAGRHRELFRKTAGRQDITKTVNFFLQNWSCLQCSLLNKKVDKYIKSEILPRYSSRVMVKKFIWQIYGATTFLAVLNGYFWILTYLISAIWNSAREKSNNNTSHHVMEENLKLLGLWNYCLAFSSSCSVLHLGRSNSRTHYRIALLFSVVQLQ